MKKDPILQTPECRQVLENLKQMKPRYLMSLVESGELNRVLLDRTRAYLLTIGKLMQKMPDEPWINLQEIAQAEHLPVNPNWEDEKPLSRREEKLLESCLRRR